MTAPTLPVHRSGVDDDLAVSLRAWALVQQAQAGDADAFGALYRRYQDVVFRYLYSRVHGDKPAAEDMCSEVFLRAFRRVGQFTWEGRDFGAWLITIARNLVADHYKSARYRYEVSIPDVRDADDQPDSGYCGDPESAVIGYLTSRPLLAGVQRLNPEQRQCIVLRFLRGFSVAETARAMGKNDGAIKALQWRALGSLREMFPDAQDFGLPEPKLPEKPERERVEPVVTEGTLARQWAVGQGIFVSPTGRLPQRVLELYRASVTP